MNTYKQKNEFSNTTMARSTINQRLEDLYYINFSKNYKKFT